MSVFLQVRSAYPMPCPNSAMPTWSVVLIVLGLVVLLGLAIILGVKYHKARNTGISETTQLA